VFDKRLKNAALGRLTAPFTWKGESREERGGPQLSVPPLDHRDRQGYEWPWFYRLRRVKGPKGGEAASHVVADRQGGK